MDPRQRELDALTRMLGKAMQDEMNDASSGAPLGFAIVVFDFGPNGFMSYASNAQRADVAKLFRELATKIETQ